jgi:hypothetical protein
MWESGQREGEDAWGKEYRCGRCHNWFSVVSPRMPFFCCYCTEVIRAQGTDEESCKSCDRQLSAVGFTSSKGERGCFYCLFH